MRKLLRLGRTDADVKLSQENKRAFFDLYHHPHGFNHSDLRFRDDSRNEWCAIEALEGKPVVELTRRLEKFGFMPNASHDGIFGYVTQAAVRLFQEYVRTKDLPFETDPPSWPDGVVGQDTRIHLAKWEESGETSCWLNDETPDHRAWIAWLASAREHYLHHPTAQMRQLTVASNRGDSLPPRSWQFDGAEPQLIGVRRNADRPLRNDSKRPVDDLFVLLVKGKTFYFRGSTDPNPSGRREAYLTEGQHLYHFNWHNIGESRRDRIYKAGRPAGAGVMVIRDVQGSNALTDANEFDGFDPAPNPTINIHWSGLGLSNWSAGCQVIAGDAYLDDLGRRIDCTAFTARNDGERGGKRSRSGPRLTMGAYTLLSDLLLCFTKPTDPAKKPTFRYTLLPEIAFAAVPGIDIAHPLNLLQAF